MVPVLPKHRTLAKRLENNLSFHKHISRRKVITRSTAFAGAAVVAAACGTDGEVQEGAIDLSTLPDGPPAMIDPATIPRGEPIDFAPAPDVPEGDLSEEVAAAVATLYGQRIPGDFTDEQWAAFETIGNSGDPRLAWLIADHIRVFVPLAQAAPGMTQARAIEINDRLELTATQLTGVEYQQFGAWNPLTNNLIAWDVPEPPNYLEGKRNIYIPLEPAWEALMVDNSVLDWRIVSWGGVLIDGRPYDTTDDPCNCIPGIDNPVAETVAEATWLTDDTVVFGVVINDEARAYPRATMEVREMVNDTLGGRDFAMPYCTLCGSAQVWFTDNLPEGIERPIFRTSGLLSRSNKVMYDITSQSIFDTFLGTADSGALLDEGIALEAHTVVTSTWGAWVEEHPNTTVIEERLALGRDPDFRNTRDADGPIFPVGDVDPRLAIQEDILGIIQENGTPLAIHVNSARSALDRGEVVQIGDDIRVLGSGDGVFAVDGNGNEIAGHQAFWLAWAQFHPSTELWPDV